MVKQPQADAVPAQRRRGVRDWLAERLGVRQEQKEEIYLQVSRSASLGDLGYWLQVLFSAGIATLGLVLNSPAVIIGAMLISPLMGPILASGLSLAAGDLVLGTRALINLALSCLVAISFAVLLVAVLPFKEVTAEIAARTHPNTLDLVIALFSGAVGSIATCKEVRGVTTSIPGVAIAVALMPPLCVVGYGLGVALTVDAADGLRLARGGGLLFFTNLVAIIFTAMVVFVVLHIDTLKVVERVREWQGEDKESVRVRALLGRLPATGKLRAARSLPGRFVVIVIILLLIAVPLTQAFLQLKREIARKQQENRIRLAATQLWEQNFSLMPNGEPRCYLGQVSLLDKDGKLALLLRVFTVKPYTSGEKAEYARLVAERVGRPLQTVAVRLIEIPTVSGELLARAEEEATAEAAMEEAGRAEEALTLAQVQSNYTQTLETSLAELRLPPPAILVGREVTTGVTAPPQVTILYLSERDIEPDAQALITEAVTALFEDQQARVIFERIEALSRPLAFGRNQTIINAADTELLDRIGQHLQRYSALRLEIEAGAERGERERISEERERVIAEYLNMKWQVAPERIEIKPGASEKRDALLRLRPAEARTG